MPLPPDLLNSLVQMNFANAPVAVAFLETAPAGLPRVERAEPASCGYWKSASLGRSFYTTPEDHGNCAVGAYTHGVSLSPALGQELQGLVGTMIDLKYLKNEDVAALPHRSTPLKFAAYAPLDQATFDPDVVVFRGNARQVMLVWEAAQAAGAFDGGSIMGRPACAMLPQALTASAGVASVGCIGNRVYTGLEDGELYLTVPGPKVTAVLEKLSATLIANIELEKFHRQRATELG
jgi:uncharacterized protein (DUF169 family)